MKQVTYIYKLSENGSDKVGEFVSSEEAEVWIDAQDNPKDFYQMTWELAE